MKKEDLKNKVEDYILNKTKNEDFLGISKIDSLKLLNKNRFDVVAKYIYAKSVKNNLALNWSKLLYKEHIRALNSFHESSNNKKSFGDFLSSFNELVRSIEKNGFDENKSLLPVGDNLNPINGAHRLGASLAYGKSISYVKIKKDTFKYNFEYLKKQGLDDEYLDNMALEYGKLKKDFHTAIVFPIVLEKIDKIKEILTEYGDIFYIKKIFLTRNGVHNLVMQMYRDHEWAKEKENKNFSKTLHHSYNRFVANKEITVFFIESTNVKKMKEAKAKIRQLFNKGNYPIHISDDNEESLRISGQVLNRNSIHFLNNAVRKNSDKFYTMFDRFNSWILENNYNIDDFCIDSSSVLVAYGLRDAKDLDYLSLHEVKCDRDDIDFHNNEVSKYVDSINDLICDPRKYFYYNGFKFLTLASLRRIKKKRGELKDKKDIKLIDSVLERGNLLKIIIDKIRYYSLVFVGFIIYFARRYTPKIIFPYVKGVYRFFKKIIK